MKEFHLRLQKLHGKPYGVYKSLAEKPWQYGDFTMEWTHVQGDPHATASRVKLSAPLKALGIPADCANTLVRRQALADYLTRRLARLVGDPEKEDEALRFVSPGPQMLVRNAMWVGEQNLEVLLQAELPGESRKIDGEAAVGLLIGHLSDVLTEALYWFNVPAEDCRAHLRCLEIRTALQEQLTERNLVAFVPNGAILPRMAGDSQAPLKNAVVFCTPPELRVELSVLGETFVGMGIPHGITVIAGGGYHGKSTLLRTLEEAVYPHVPGDGREYVVVEPSACKVRTEEGRPVRETRLAPLVRELPGHVNTERFCTANASGSTSQATNLLEAIELGAKTLLLDEDASAVNFLVRDERMQRLVRAEHEPLIPLVDRIREISARGLDFIMVIGACGDYLSVADTVIVMSEYRAECATQRAREVCSEDPPRRLVENAPPLGDLACRAFLPYMLPLRPGLRPNSAVERQVKVRVQGAALLQVGRLKGDMSKVTQFCDNAQMRGAGLLLLNAMQNVGELSIREQLEALCAQVENGGFRKVPQAMNWEVALPRAIEIGMALMRLRVPES
jgi:predicted ABC-class ATPase